MLIALLFLVQTHVAYANNSDTPFSTPECLDAKGQSLPVIDQQVIQWKTTTPNQFLARAHVQGVISDIYPNVNGHAHFGIDLDSNSKDTLEMIYNLSFGALPKLSVGMTVEACGDFINSDAATPQYPASPDGAIMHWIHRNPSAHGHASGYLMINGSLYGQGSGHGN